MKYNLANILRNHLTETFYHISVGEVQLIKIIDNTLYFKSHVIDKEIIVYSNGSEFDLLLYFDGAGNCVLFPDYSSYLINVQNPDKAWEIFVNNDFKECYDVYISVYHPEIEDNRKKDTNYRFVHHIPTNELNKFNELYKQICSISLSYE